MRFQLGQKRPSNAGRKKGSVNKVSVEIKVMIQGALDELGGQKFLVACARKNPAAFLTLLGKIIPREVRHGGDSDTPPIEIKNKELSTKEVARRIGYILLSAQEEDDAEIPPLENTVPTFQ